jgi:WD40 repeat protein
LLVWGAQRWYDRKTAELIPALHRPESWVVDRPDELKQIVAPLRRRHGGTVGITTAVYGAGGFGKTTVAKMVRADRRVLRRFGSRVYWVTLGRDAGREVLAGLVNGLIAQLEPGRAVTFTTAQQASDHLAAVLSGGPRRLLVLDDVWSEEQLAAFPVAGRCARLVTTRIPSLATGTGVPVRVDQMSDEQARALLLAGLPELPPGVARALVDETGRWPLLLRLVNKILADQEKLQPDITPVAEDLLDRLRLGGKLQVDQLTGAASQQLDVNDPDQRRKAVRATIQASTSLLSAGEHDRFAELAVFAEDETIPVTLITELWRVTGGLDEITTRALCVRLADLALLTLIPGDGAAVTMHDVIREFLRQELGDTSLTRLHSVLLDTVADGLQAAPAAESGSSGGGTVTSWWTLPGSARYLWEHLIEHMLAAGWPGQAGQLASDLRWVGARLQRSGPAGPYADLVLIGTRRAERLGRVLGQAAHLLAPTEPEHSLIDILYSRVAHAPGWNDQVQDLTATLKLPALTNRWPLPDLPHDALLRTITGHSDGVTAVAIAPDGTWLATASSDQTVRIWDFATGQQRATLTGHSGGVTAVAIAPDGTWLATASSDQTVRIWNPATRRHRILRTDHTTRVRAVAIAPDGTWLATGSRGWTLQTYDVVTGKQRAILAGFTDGVTAVAIAPDGTWLATAGSGQTVRIWNPATRQQRDIRTNHSGAMTAVAISPDGDWLATASEDKTVRIWDWTAGHRRATLTGHTDTVTAVAISPDCTWLATASLDRTMRIWDSASGQTEAALGERIHPMSTVAFAPDGTWLATASEGETVQIWDEATGEQRATLTSRGHRVAAVAIAPDGTWLATADDDGVRLWDPTTGHERTTFTSHSGTAAAVAIAPDGTWLATAGNGGSVRIWDAVTGQERTSLTGDHGSVYTLAIAPDGTWLATADDDGVRIWDPVTGQQRTSLTSDHGPVHTLAIAPDGTWLASGNEAKTVWIWDIATGQRRVTLTGHNDGVTAVAIAPNGTWLATTSLDGTIRIWHPATGAIRALMRVDRRLKACTWSPTGHMLAAAGDAGLYLFTFNS